MDSERTSHENKNFYNFTNSFSDTNNNNNMPLEKGKKGKHWCFTLNNPDTETRSYLKYLKSTTPSIEYIVGGDEVGENGTPHIQGYVKFHVDWLFKRVKDLLGRAHVEGKSRNSTVEQAVQYCKKDGKFWEYGTIPQESEPDQMKCRWKRARELAEAGQFDEIDDRIFISHHGALKTIARDKMKKSPDLHRVCGLWIHGRSGCGKTQYTRKRWPGLYPKPMSKWWDGYDAQDVCVLDDVDPKNGEWLPYFLKIWADSVSFISESKGGARSIRPKLFVVTSQYTINEVWTDEATREAIGRRFEEIELIQERRDSFAEAIDGFMNEWQLLGEGQEDFISVMSEEEEIADFEEKFGC